MTFKNLFVFSLGIALTSNNAWGMEKKEKEEFIRSFVNDRIIKRTIENINVPHSFIKQKEEMLVRRDKECLAQREIEKRNSDKLLALNSLEWNIRELENHFSKLEPTIPAVITARKQCDYLKYMDLDPKKWKSSESVRTMITNIQEMGKNVDDIAQNYENTEDYWSIKRKLAELNEYDPKLMANLAFQKKEEEKLRNRLNSIGRNKLKEALNLFINKETLTDVTKLALESFIASKITDIFNAIYHWNADGVAPEAAKHFINLFTDQSITHLANAVTYVTCLASARNKAEYDNLRNKVIIEVDQIKRLGNTENQAAFSQHLQNLYNDPVVRSDPALFRFVADKYTKLTAAYVTQPLPSSFIATEEKLQQEQRDREAQKAAKIKQQDAQKQKLKDQATPVQQPQQPVQTTAAIQQPAAQGIASNATQKPDDKSGSNSSNTGAPQGHA